MKNFLQIRNILIIATAISLPIVVADQYMRFAKLPRNNSRVMLLSGGRLDSSGIGVRHYTPNSSIRHSAVYGDILEYSHEFKTDKNGFRVTHNCSAINKTNNLTVITGDSFTEGQGSDSVWIESIQRQLCEQGINSVNVAIAGYGIEDMKDSLDYAYEKLGANKAIVAIIPDDIYRPRVPMTSSLSCSMYQSRRCGDSATWWHHHEDLNSKDLIAFAATKHNFGIRPVLESLGLMQKLRKIVKRVLNYSSDTKQAKEILKRVLNYSSDTKRAEYISRSISAMNSITLKYLPKNVSLIILPTKYERNLKGSPELKTRRSTEFVGFLESINKNVSIKDLRECPLGEKHFFSIDGHPNEEGHKLLSKCALNQITNIE